MARYTFFFLILFFLFLLVGCPGKQYTFVMSIYNDCAEPAVLYYPGETKGRNIEPGHADSDGFLIRTQSYFGISDEELKEQITESLDSDESFTLEFANKQKIHFTGKDILKKGEWPYPSGVHYYICKSQNATEAK